MDKRKVVMLSSTALDLPDHREQARLACERAGFDPRHMMEHLPARDTDAVKASLQMVKEADVYIAILAFRYGYVPDGEGISITEMEYNRARELKKPRLVFFMDKKHPITSEDVETGEGASKLEAFKDRTGKQRVAAYFKSAGDLRGHIVEALTTLGKELDAEEPGEAPLSVAAKLHRRTWIPALPAPYIAHPYTLSQVRHLVGRHAELNEMTDWVANPASKAFGARLFCFVAIGGMGKSALTWKWFNEIAPEEMKPLAGRLWWSFYESDGAFEHFVTRALAYVSEQSEEAVRTLSRPERETQLLARLDEAPFLLVLDGLERVLVAYHRMDASHLADDELDEQTAKELVSAAGLPASAAQSFVGQHRMRQCTDPRAGAFLRRLSQVKRSRALVSTRLYPSELQVPTGHPWPGCFACFLPGLTDDDALGLWRALGVSGSRGELVPIFRSVGGHPLLVQALASEVARYRKAPGDFARWRRDHSDFDPARLPLVQSRTHILEYALAELGDDLQEVLHTVVGSRLPATYDMLEALLVGEDKACASAKELDRALSELEDRGLIGWDREANRYDAHPIVRGVVWQQTSAKDKEAVYRALDAHFEPMATPDNWRDVESLDDLAPAIERYHTLVGLGRYDDAYDLFYDRLEPATLWRLAAHRERIEWLEGIFPEGPAELPALTDEGDQAHIFSALAQSYQKSGQPGRAVPLFARSNEMLNRQEDKANLQTGLDNLGLALSETGALRAAIGVLRRSLLLSRELEDANSEAISLYMLGAALVSVGEHELSGAVLGRSQYISAKHGHPSGESRATAHLTERSLWFDDFGKAANLADRAWELAGVDRTASELIHAALLQGQAALGLADLERADERLHYALTRARAVNMVQFELQALIHIAELERRQDRFAVANDRLSEVWEAAERGPYPLYVADAYNVFADIELALGNQAAAIESATKAFKAAWCDGPPYAYHWGLERAKVHLAALGAPKPELAPFDETSFGPMPQVELNPKDEYWVDATALE